MPLFDLKKKCLAEEMTPIVFANNGFYAVEYFLQDPIFYTHGLMLG